MFDTALENLVDTKLSGQRRSKNDRKSKGSNSANGDSTESPTPNFKETTPKKQYNFQTEPIAEEDKQSDGEYNVNEY